MFNKKIIAAAAAVFIFAGEAYAGTAGNAAAERIGEALIKAFSPERVSITVAEDGGRAWAECESAKIAGIRIKSVKLDAEIDREQLKNTASGIDIMGCIKNSKGEITLAERDVNDFFSNSAAGGFSSLVFDFTPNGYKAAGHFKADLLMLQLDLDLQAEGKLGIESDGVYLEDTVIYAEGSRQSEMITDLVIEKINPLLPFSAIPFPVEFNSIIMTEEEVTLSGAPESPGEGETWDWSR